MKAPCCLLGAAALPRPPEGARSSSSRSRWLYHSTSGVSYTYLLSVWWVIITVVMGSAIASGSRCPIRTDAVDVESKAYISPQVVEALVQDVVVGGSADGDRRVYDGEGGVTEMLLPGQIYTVTVSVSKVLRRYRGPSRVKKRATLSLTFRSPSSFSDTGIISGDSNTNIHSDECLVIAGLRRHRKYIFFLSGEGEEAESSSGSSSSSSSRKGPVPMAPPEPANKKIRRLVRKMVCKRCGGPPTVTGPRDDSVVRYYNLTLECTAQGNPTPTILWYKDGILLTTSKNIKIRTRKRRRKMVLRGRGIRTPRHSSNPFMSESFTRRRRIRSRRGHGTGVDVSEANDGAGAAAGKKTEKKRRIRGGGGGGGGGGDDGGGRRRDDNDRRRLPGRRRIGTGIDNVAGLQGNGLTGIERRRRPGAERSFTRSRTGSSSQLRSDIKPNRITESSIISSTGESADSSRSSNPESSINRKKQSGESRRTKAIVSSLTVRSVEEEHAGIYKCVAKSVAGEASSQARIRVIPPIDPHIFVDKCPYSGYCLNGGTCMMFKIVGELVCQCAEGFKGQRCEEKEVYPTFRRDCHGPLRHSRHSHGLRCPRNQPAALWELLQQSLARNPKLSSWTKTHLLSWSPTDTTYWPRLIPPIPHSSVVHHQNASPAYSGLQPTVHTPLTITSPVNPNTHQSTQTPEYEDSEFPHPDHPQILQWKDHLDSLLRVSSSYIPDQDEQREHEEIVYPISTSRTFADSKWGPDSQQNTHRHLLTVLPPTQPYNYGEKDLVHPSAYSSQKIHRRHNHSSHNAKTRSQKALHRSTYPTEAMSLPGEEETSEARLSGSLQLSYIMTPSTSDQNKMQQ